MASFFWPLLFCLICVKLTRQMTVDPERIAARLRIEAEIDEDYAKRTGRNRRQLGSPKEVTIQVGFICVFRMRLT